MSFASGVGTRLATRARAAARAAGALVSAGAALALAAGALSGCGVGVGAASGPVTITVTRDFGAHLVHAWSVPAPRAQTALSLLMRYASVSRGGDLVQAIDGLAAGRQASGGSARWVLYINGVEPAKGAAMANVHPGDRFWGDLHDAGAAAAPAVVGSFPEPFLHGLEGKRLPVRVECAGSSSAACRTVEASLQRIGVPAALAATGPGVQPDTLRVLVGPWSALRGDLAAQAIERGPRASGVFARFSPDGRVLMLLNERGQTARALTGAGLIAATRSAEQAPVWLVTGGDEAAVQYAARALAPAPLQDRFALALASSGAALPAPVAR